MKLPLFHLALVVMLAGGCISFQQQSNNDNSDMPPWGSEESYLKEQLNHLEGSLLLMPYCERRNILSLYGSPLKTSTNVTGILIDTHVLPESVVLKTYWSASDPNDYDSLQWADFMPAEMIDSPQETWRFEYPERVVDVESLIEKVALLGRLNERLISESKSISKTDTFKDGEILREYFEKEHFDLPVGKELWRRNGKVVAKGRHKNFRRWSGSFLDEIHQDTDVFRSVIYKKGVLLHSIIPEWQEVNDSRRFGDPFVRGKVSVPNIDSVPIKRRYLGPILSIFNETNFLAWAASNDVNEGYRVVISPSFSPATVFKVVLNSDLQSPTIEYSITDGQAGYRDTMTQIAHQSKRELTKREAKELRNTVSRRMFWKNVREHSVRACDGWSLDYEGVKNGQYAYRHYSNSDAMASEALAHKLLSLIPSEEAPHYVGRKADSYLWNLGKCFRDSIRLLEASGRQDLVNDAISDPSHETIIKCLLSAKETLPNEIAKKHFYGNIDLVEFDNDKKRLIHSDGREITIEQEKEVAVWDDSWMYNYSFFCEGEESEGGSVSIKLTTASTCAAYRKTTTPAAPTPTAIKIMKLLGLGFDRATVVDWGIAPSKGSKDRIEKIIIVPPSEMQGGHSYRITVNHTARNYSVRTSAGVGHMGGFGGSVGPDRDFEDGWE